MSILIAAGVVWFWSGRCFAPKTRKRIGAATAVGSALIWLKFARDIVNIDKVIK